MKKIYTSIVAAAVLSTGAFAESNTIKDAFANGKVSGDITLYSEYTSASGTNVDSSYTNSSIGLNYETDSFNGFKAALGGRTNHLFTEKEEGNYDGGEDDPEAVLTTANISYATDKAALIVGRQEIDLEWITDYHEAVVGVLSYVPDTTIVVGHTTRKMEADQDAALQKMSHIKDLSGVNSNNGASVIDVKYEGIADTVINPYFMNAQDFFSAYGLKVTTTVANVDLTAHYAKTSEDVAGTEDGFIGHIELGTTVGPVSLAAGYITTGKKNGIGNLSALGDNIDPSENLENIYGKNADTFYGNISAEVASINLMAQYATVDYESTKRDSELILSVGTNLTEELSLDVVYYSINAEDSADDTDTVYAMATYSF